MPTDRSTNAPILDTRTAVSRPVRGARRWATALGLAFALATGATVPSATAATSPPRGLGSDIAPILPAAVELPTVIPVVLPLGLLVVAVAAVAAAGRLLVVRRRGPDRVEAVPAAVPGIPRGVPEPDVERRLADALESGQRRHVRLDAPGAPAWVRRLGSDATEAASDPDDVEGHWFDPRA